MKLSTMWLVFINAVITMISLNSLADNDCLTGGEIKSISAPYQVYFDDDETSSVIEYKVEFENTKNATDTGEYSNAVDTIEVYSKKNNCRDNFNLKQVKQLKQLKHCCESKLVMKYSYAQAAWAYFDNSFDMGCQNKTLSLTMQNPRDLYITLKLMSNDSIIHCYTTHLYFLSSSYYNSGECMEPNNQCEEPILGGIESIEMIEGPDLYKNDDPNSYTLHVNTDKKIYDTYNYEIAYKTKTSKKLAFHGWVVTAWYPELNKFDKFFWMDGEGVLHRYLKHSDSDKHDFAVIMSSEKIIFYNYSKNFTRLGLTLHVVRSKVPSIFVDVVKDNRPQESRTHFPSGRQTVTKQEPFIIQEEPIKTTTASPSELMTEMTTKLINSTQSTNTKTEAGNVTDYFSDYKIDYFLFGSLGAGLILWTVWHYY